MKNTGLLRTLPHLQTAPPCPYATAAAEKRFRAMVESGRDVVALVDARGQVHSFTSNLETLTGYTPEELDGGRCFSFVHPADLPRLMTEAGAIFGQMKVELSPYRFRTRDDRWIWVEVRLTNYLDDPDIGAIIANFRDVTRHRQAEALRRVSEERYRLLFESNPVPMWIFSREGYRIAEANAAAQEKFGYSKGDMHGLTVFDLVNESDVVRMQRLLQQEIACTGYRQYPLVSHRRSDGSLMVADLFTHDIQLETGPHTIAILFDMTEKMELEQLVIQERLAAQQELFKAIIDTQERERSEIGKELHDNINQLLTTAKLYVENIHYYPDEQPRYVEKSVGLMQRSIREIRSLSKALVTPTLYDIGFRESLQEMIDHYRELHLFGLHYSITGDLKRIDQGVRLTVYRVIQEQFNNIVKYAGCTDVWVTIREEGGSLHLQVRDNGQGFDPAGRPGGLGLSNIRNRSEVYNGKVTLWAAPGEGCTLQVEFPGGSRE